MLINFASDRTSRRLINYPPWSTSSWSCDATAAGRVRADSIETRTIDTVHIDSISHFISLLLANALSRREECPEGSRSSLRLITAGLLARSRGRYEFYRSIISRGHENSERERTYESTRGNTFTVQQKFSERKSASRSIRAEEPARNRATFASYFRGSI